METNSTSDGGEGVVSIEPLEEPEQLAGALATRISALYLQLGYPTGVMGRC